MADQTPLLLLAEDDESTAIMIRDLARSLGWKVLHASNGEEAFQLFLKIEPDLMLVDYFLPRLDGLEILERVRQSKSRVPIVIMTAVFDESVILQALRLGATDFLRKPFEHLSLLMNILKRENRRYQSNRVLKLLPSRILRQSVTFEIENDLAMGAAVCSHIAEAMTRGADTYPVRLGLEELCANAIEHGNREVTTAMKHEALERHEPGAYARLLAERSQTSPWRERRVRVHATMQEGRLDVMISDEGNGFDCTSLPSPLVEEQSPIAHGRGISLARLQFDELEFLGNGNTVRVRRLLRG